MVNQQKGWGLLHQSTATGVQEPPADSSDDGHVLTILPCSQRIEDAKHLFLAVYMCWDMFAHLFVPLAPLT